MKIFTMFICLAAAMSPTLVLAQKPASPAGGKTSDIAMLSGCVSADPKARKTFTLSDATQDQTYRLTGIDVRDYVGRHVEVLGATQKRFRVVGGLYPNANVAAQAGSIDPTKAAMAAHSGPAANSPQPLIEFKVKSVRITPGACADQ